MSDVEKVIEQGYAEARVRVRYAETDQMGCGVSRELPGVVRGRAGGVHSATGAGLQRTWSRRMTR